MYKKKKIIRVDVIKCAGLKKTAMIVSTFKKLLIFLLLLDEKILLFIIF
jgi:hypothetical protein